MSERASAPHHRRVWILILLLPFFCAALLWLGVNVFLATKKIEGIVSEGDGYGFNLSYDWAYMLYPGLVELRALRLWGTDENVNWEVRLDRAGLHLDLTRLLDRTLRGTSLEVKGSSVRIRHHLSSELPEIIARLKAKEREDRLRNPNPASPWKIEISDINLRQLREIRFDRYRFKGESTITGEFFLQPKRWLRVSDAGWIVKSGHWEQVADQDLVQNGVDFLRDFRGKFSVEIALTDLKKVKGSQIFKNLDLDGRVNGQTSSASLLSLLFPGYGTLQFGRGEGEFDAVTKVKGGVLQPGSRSRVNLRKMDLRLLGLQVKGKGELLAKVTSARQLEMDFKILNLEGRTKPENGENSMAIDGGEIHFLGSASDLSLISPFEDLLLKIQAKDLGLRNLEHLISHFTNEPVAVIPLHGERGALNVSAVVMPARSEAQLEMSFESPAMTYRRMEKGTVASTLTSSVRLRAGLRSDEFNARRFQLGEVLLNLEDLNLQKIGKKEDAYRRPEWQGKVQFVNGSLQFAKRREKFAKVRSERTPQETAPSRAADGVFQFHSGFDVSMSDLNLPVRFLMDPSFWVRMGLRFFPMKGLSGGGNVAIEGQRLSLTDLELRAGAQKISGFVQDTKKSTTGRVYLRILPLPFCYGLSNGEKGGLSVVLSENACLGETQMAE